MNNKAETIKKILIVIMYSGKYPSTLILKIIKLTWAKKLPPEVDLIYLEDSKNKTYFDNEHLYIDTSDFNKSLNLVNQRFLSGLMFINNNFSYDLIYKTTTTCYIEINNLINYSKNLPQDIYSGQLIHYPPKNRNIEYPQISKKDRSVIYASGSGTFLSKSYVDLIEKNFHLYKLKHYDDVALGYFFQHLNISPISSHVENLNYYPKNFVLTSDAFHFRFKLGKFSPLKLPRFLEPLILIKLHLIKTFNDATTAKKISYYLFDIFALSLFRLFLLPRKIINYFLVFGK